MNFVPQEIEEYASKHSTAHSELLDELYRETHLKVLVPAMISGPIQGRFLSMISHLIRPKYILELGTYTGYATLCLAEGLEDNGMIYTVDKNEELRNIQRKYWDRSEYGDKINSIIGDAIEIIPTLDHQWDLVFLDADKSNYFAYYEMLIPKMRSGSIMLIDNVLWYGKVTTDIHPDDLDTLEIDRLNKHILADNRVEQVLLPFRDGINMVRIK